MKLSTLIEHLQVLAKHPDVGPDIEVVVPTKWDDGEQFAPTIGIAVSAICPESSWHMEPWTVFPDKGKLDRDPLWAESNDRNSSATAEEWKKQPKMLTLHDFGPGLEMPNVPVIKFRGVPLDQARFADDFSGLCERCGLVETNQLVNCFLTCEECRISKRPLR